MSIEDFVPSNQHVRACDNSRREVFGDSDVGAYHRAHDLKSGILSTRHSFILQHAFWVIMDS